MKIIDLLEDKIKLYCLCLEDWSEEILEAGNHKELWYEKMKDKGLRVKLAVDDEGKVGGMIQYVPIEFSPAEGKDLYYVLCIWVHGHKKGRGNFQKKGFGKSLIEAAEKDVKDLGAKGLVTWGISLPFWMKASWFKKQGYKKIDKQGMMVLLWKPFAEDAIPPVWIRRKSKPTLIDGKVKVTGYINGWCPAQNMVFERAKKASAEFGDKVIFEEINTFDKEVLNKYGISDALFINDKEVNSGPPPSFKKIRKKILKKIK